MNRCLRLSVFLIVFPALAFAQELPVTRVVLFTSGVGFFEHSGTVTGNAEVPLTFTGDQVNDVLKSLILRDPTGEVGEVGYPSQDPLERSLASFALDLGGPGGLASLLPQLRGVRVTLNTPEQITGRLVGLDQRQEKDTSETWLTLAAADGLRIVPLSSVTQLKILDPGLDQELNQALVLLAGSRDVRKKTVTAHFLGSGTRQVSLGYISEAPVWKTSYRLDLSGGKPFLQAWAIVENTGESDWNQVRLSLVSGRPVSFIQDLYTPWYVRRPVYQPEVEAGPGPRLPQAGFAPVPAAKSALAEETSGFQNGTLELRRSGVKAAASGSPEGELFQFSLRTPISLARHQSALIPLAASDVTARKVSLFNADIDPLHPQNAVWITNNTGSRLPAGPVTVYDEGVYAGDALTDTLLENDRRLWTYATDLAVRADSASDDEQTTTKITVVKGVLQYKKDFSWNRTYRFANTGSARTLLVEHPFHAERTLLQPAAVEKTADAYRFTVDVPAGGRAELAVKETQTLVETQGLSSWRTDQLTALVQGTGPLSPSAKTALQKVADLKAKVDRATQDTASSAREKAEQEDGQVRIRENLEAVGRESAQGQIYLKRLLDSEAKIDQLTQQLTAARLAQTAAEKELDDDLRTLTVE
jgi:hypothetical protein